MKIVVLLLNLGISGAVVGMNDAQLAWFDEMIEITKDKLVIDAQTFSDTHFFEVTQVMLDGDPYGPNLPFIKCRVANQERHQTYKFESITGLTDDGDTVSNILMAFGSYILGKQGARTGRELLKVALQSQFFPKQLASRPRTPIFRLRSETSDRRNASISGKDADIADLKIRKALDLYERTKEQHEKMCCACMNQPRDRICMPCRHLLLCEDCCKKADRCPLWYSLGGY